ncbi:MAG: hypothetical protein E7Z90_03680 [Cyanobacteria bacterium SIG29]|nr:hypothetical protein [Cyanobacteria bacterium SIG29]
MYATIFMGREVVAHQFIMQIRKNIFKLFIVCFSLFCLNIGIVFAVEEHSENAVTMEQDSVKLITGSINFDDISKKAKNHSYDIKLADFDIFITKQGIREARSEYFPKINAVATTEYTKNFNDIWNSSVTTVGDAFINPYTRFQSLFGITLSYNLFDFGIRRNNLDIAKEDTEIKKLALKLQFQELDMTLIDTYCKLLIAQKQIEINNEILKLAQENLEMKERLLEAKEISRTEVNEQRALVMNTQKSISELKAIVSESINWISFYTGENYDIDNIVVKEFKKPDFDPLEFSDYTKSIVWQIQEKEVKKKELTYRIAKKNYLPRVNAYGRYYIYGSDHSSYNDALKDISPSNYTVGGSVVLPVFDGLKTSAMVQKAAAELKKQLVERDKAIAELMNKISIMRGNLFYLEKQAQDSNLAYKELFEKEKSLEKLLDKKVISPIELNESKIETLKQKIEYEKNAITTVAIQKAIQTITSY